MIPLSMLTGLAGTIGKSPLARVAAKYWWLMIPAGYLLWTKIQKRRKAGESIGVAQTIEDVGVALSPVIPIIMLGEMAAANERQMAGMAGIQHQAAPAAPQLPPPAQAPATHGMPVEFARPG